LMGPMPILAGCLPRLSGDWRCIQSSGVLSLIEVLREGDTDDTG
jgi:hypothetical protein